MKIEIDFIDLDEIEFIDFIEIDFDEIDLRSSILE